jgi:hypothetical protein
MWPLGTTMKQFHTPPLPYYLDEKSYIQGGILMAWSLERVEAVRCLLSGSFLLHIIFVIPMIVNDVNLSVAFRGVSGLSS